MRIDADIVPDGRRAAEVSRAIALAKLAKARELSTQAAQLAAEASDELEAEESGVQPAVEAITDSERAEMRRRFLRKGIGA